MDARHARAESPGFAEGTHVGRDEPRSTLGLRTAAVLGVVAVFGGLLAADAAAKPIPSKVSMIALGLIDPTTGSYEYDFGVGIGGLLTHGDKRRCAGGRKVTLYRKVPSAPDDRVGTKRTDGILHIAIIRWIDPDPASIAGSYYAKVEGATRHKRGHRLKCSPAQSDTLDIVAPKFTEGSPGANLRSRITSRLHIGALHAG
jgi:hypothetical protein